MTTDPFDGVTLDPSWVRRLEAAESRWADLARGVSALGRLAADGIAINLASLRYPDEAETNTVDLTFADGTRISLAGVRGEDAVGLTELLWYPDTQILPARTPEPVVDGWLIRLRMTSPELGPVLIAMVAAEITSDSGPPLCSA